MERRPEYVSDIFDCFTFSENTKLRFILSWFEIYLYIWHKQAKKDIYVVQLCQIKMARGARKIVSSTASLGIGKIKLRSYQGLYISLLYLLFEVTIIIYFPVGNNISSPIVLEHFVVMEDYKKQAKTDINLKKGKIVDVIEKRECGELF